MWNGRSRSLIHIHHDHLRAGDVGRGKHTALPLASEPEQTLDIIQKEKFAAHAVRYDKACFKASESQARRFFAQDCIICFLPVAQIEREFSAGDTQCLSVYVKGSVIERIIKSNSRGETNHVLEPVIQHHILLLGVLIIINGTAVEEVRAWCKPHESEDRCTGLHLSSGRERSWCS